MSKEPKTPIATATRTMQGVKTPVTMPYVEGHVITEAEAKALNQVRAEGIGNNMRTKIKTMQDEGKEEAEILEAIAAYDAEYVINMSNARTSRVTDPTEREAIAIAKAYITAKLKDAGTTQKAYIEAKGKDTFDAAVMKLAENPKVIEAAERAIAEREKISSLSVEGLESVEG